MPIAPPGTTDLEFEGSDAPSRLKEGHGVEEGSKIVWGRGGHGRVLLFILKSSEGRY